MPYAYKPDVCFYHGPFCQDGAGAAYAVWKKYGNAVKYVPVGYDGPIHGRTVTTGLNLLFVDYSPRRQDLDLLAQSAETILILDHHKSAEESLRPFVYAPHSLAKHYQHLGHIWPELTELNRPKIVAFFDMDKSGARMAWEFFHGEDVPLFIQLIEDRDLWRFKHGDDTMAFHQYLKSLSRINPVPTFRDWVFENQTYLQAALVKGKAMHDAHVAFIAELLENAYHTQIGDYIVPCLNVPGQVASDCGNSLVQKFPDAPFVASWYIGSDGKVHASLRSRKGGGADVSEVAKSLGGGGHFHASGFLCEQPLMAVQPRKFE